MKSTRIDENESRKFILRITATIGFVRKQFCFVLFYFFIMIFPFALFTVNTKKKIVNETWDSE